MHLEPLLKRATLCFGVLALLCLAALAIDAPPILGIHPAIKPLKFNISIVFFLFTLAILLPKVTLTPPARRVFAWVFIGTMVLEIIPILVQPVRGTTSHFNVDGLLSLFFWRLMAGAITVTTAGMLALAWVATRRPLRDGTQPLHPWLAFAWRASLWMFVLSAVSGFAMGSRLSHTVGGLDGGPGLPFVNWSLEHGDLRIAHFLALHAMQVLPCIAWAAVRLLPAGAVGWGVVIASVGIYAGITVLALVRAFLGLAF